MTLLSAFTRYVFDIPDEESIFSWALKKGGKLCFYVLIMLMFIEHYYCHLPTDNWSIFITGLLYFQFIHKTNTNIKMNFNNKGTEIKLDNAKIEKE